jgi:outer membrane receptor protein involved in Fe transport
MNTSEFKNDGITLVNANIAYSSGDFAARIDVRNLLNEFYTNF